MAPLLEVHGLSVRYRSRTGEEVVALDGANLRIAPGEILGVLGESGCGKSTLAASLLSLFPYNAIIEEGAVIFETRNLLKLSPAELARIRGKRISLIFQEPGLALHPTMRVGAQIEEVLRAHTELNADDRRRRAKELLALIFSSEVDRLYSSYPHQLSGGQRQRIVIAQAVSCMPALLIADEPTASLDPGTQREILELLQRLRKELNLAILFITHSPDLLSGFADRIMVMYAGRIVEISRAEDLLRSPRHPYTAALLRCRPTMREAVSAGTKARIHVIQGDPPNPHGQISGCAFEPRCLERMELCRGRRPPLTTTEPGQEVACFQFGD